jgi:hypothetical protein
VIEVAARGARCGIVARGKPRLSEVRLVDVIGCEECDLVHSAA